LSSLSIKLPRRPQSGSSYQQALLGSEQQVAPNSHHLPAGFGVRTAVAEGARARARGRIAGSRRCSGSASQSRHADACGGYKKAAPKNVRYLIENREVAVGVQLFHLRQRWGAAIWRAQPNAGLPLSAEVRSARVGGSGVQTRSGHSGGRRPAAGRTPVGLAGGRGLDADSRGSRYGRDVGYADGVRRSKWTPCVRGARGVRAAFGGEGGGGAAPLRRCAAAWGRATPVGLAAVGGRGLDGGGWGAWNGGNRAAVPSWCCGSERGADSALGWPGPARGGPVFSGGQAALLGISTAPLCCLALLASCAPVSECTAKRPQALPIPAAALVL
jgi:hypothetical protein